MKNFKIIFTFLIPFLGLQNFAQTPTNCFEIESILVDACGTPENGNEMVRFKVGPNPLDASLMLVDWPNNGFLGLIQDAQTATTTANINATITSCGHLIEPPAYILPAGASVLLITSQMVNVAANSFANLSDTLYVLYQNLPAPTQNGHFSNSASTPRTLIIDFTSPANCGDTVSYLGSSLPGGNGALANFEWDGTVSYANNGCQALLVPSGINITTPEPIVLCAGDPINLSANAFGNYTEIIWSGGNGTFSLNDVENTTYNSTTTDNVDFYLYAGVRATCNDTILDSILVTIATPTIKNLTPTSYDLCPGEIITLTASGGTASYLWSTTETSNSIDVSSAATYNVTIDDGCYTEILSAIITDIGTLPTISISGNTDICSGQTTVLSATGDGTITWNNSFTGNDFTTSNDGQYYAVATNGCGTDTAFVTVNNIGIFPNATITGDLFVCDANDAVSLTVSGGDSYTWSNGSINTSENLTFGSNYYVVATNNCGNDTLFFEVENQSVVADFSTSELSGEAPLEVTFTNQSTNATNYSWSFGNGTTANNANTSSTFNESGDYDVLLVASNSFGCLDTAFASITVLEIPEIIIPNIFTPNGDQSNDLFKVASNYITNVKGTIYNRWGTLLYTLENTVFFWDGSIYSGEAASDGVYFYTLSVELINGETREFNGHVTLMR